MHATSWHKSGTYLMSNPMLLITVLISLLSPIVFLPGAIIHARIGVYAYLYYTKWLCKFRLYIEEEIYAPENQSPPLGEGFALAAIRSKARNYRRAGTDVGEILQASQRLAHAQSERQATACRLLPPVHWALLYTIGALFVSTFILFETGGSFSNEGRHILFTVLCGLMSFVLCVSSLSCGNIVRCEVAGSTAFLLSRQAMCTRI